MTESSTREAPLSDADFTAYNRMAERMDQFVSSSALPPLRPA